jgi:hypothetical protein
MSFSAGDNNVPETTLERMSQMTLGPCLGGAGLAFPTSSVIASFVRTTHQMRRIWAEHPAFAPKCKASLVDPILPVLRLAKRRHQCGQHEQKDIERKDVFLVGVRLDKHTVAFTQSNTCKRHTTQIQIISTNEISLICRRSSPTLLVWLYPLRRRGSRVPPHL